MGKQDIDTVRRTPLPRTLVGVGGVRLLNHPGIKHPPHILQARPGYEPRSGKPYRKPPPWGIGTWQAADLLGCGSAAARALLHRHGVKFRVVQEPGKPPCNLWDRDAVAALARERDKTRTRLPPAMMDSRQAMKHLGVSRSCLQRYVQRGYLQQRMYRIQTPRGIRLRAYLPAPQVHALATLLRRMRAKEAELHELRLQLNTMRNRETKFGLPSVLKTCTIVAACGVRNPCFHERTGVLSVTRNCQEPIMDERESAAALPPVKKRYEWIDNARIVAAFLIMYVHWRWRMDMPDSDGHFILKNYVSFSSLYGRVPFFLILAGYFLGRNITWKKAWDRFLWLLIPFAIWNAIAYAAARISGQPAESITSILGLGPVFSRDFFAIDPTATVPVIVPSWFLRDIMILSLITPLLAKIKPLLAFGICFAGACSAFSFPLDQAVTLNPATCIFFCLGVCLSNYRIDDAYRILNHRFTWVALLLYVAASYLSLHESIAHHQGMGATLFGMLLGALMIAYTGVLIEKHLPRVSKYVAPCGPACFLVFMLHYPILTAIYTWAPRWLVDSHAALLVPIPVFIFIVTFFLLMKRYTPWLMPYLGHMKLPKKTANPGAGGKTS